MNKPEDIPQGVWLSAITLQQSLVGNRADCISMDEFHGNTVRLASALMGAKEEERAACLQAVLDEQMEDGWVGESDHPYSIAIENAAAAISNRGAA
jgi:hypothetical protein